MQHFKSLLLMQIIYSAVFKRNKHHVVHSSFFASPYSLLSSFKLMDRSSFSLAFDLFIVNLMHSLNPCIDAGLQNNVREIKDVRGRQVT